MILTGIDSPTIGRHLSGIDEMPLLLGRTGSRLAGATTPVYNHISFQKQHHFAGGLHALMLILLYDFMLLRLLNDHFFTAFTT